MAKESMKGDTCLFKEEDLIYFGEGLFGFKDRKRFLPFSIEEGKDTVLYLQSVEDEALSFVVMNPFVLMEDYAPAVAAEDLKELDAARDEDLSFYVICVVRGTPEESTVNLKCPIVVNTVNRQAKQVILDSGDYGFRHALKDFKKEDAANADSAEKKR